MIRYLVPILLILLAGCQTTKAASPPYVDLSQRTPLPAVAAVEEVSLRMAVAAILSPQGNVESYRGLASYLSNRLGQAVEMVQRRTYAEVNDLVGSHMVDIAFVCTSAYVDGYDRFGMELIAAPEIEGESVYYSQVIVPFDSPARSMADLEGAIFAFTDPMSFTGRVYPTSLVQELDERPESFFRSTVFTYSHDRAIEAVAAGIADGAAVDSLVLRYAMARDPDLSSKLRIIHTSTPFGIPPVVVPPDLPARQKAQLQEILLGMHRDEAGQTVLAELGNDRFVPIEDAAYNSVRDLIALTGSLP